MSLEKYESKQQRVRRPAQLIYTMVSDFNNFTPVMSERVENWQADGDKCSFTVKGMNLSLQIIERSPADYVKISGGDTSPMPFTFWFQMKELAPDDIRIRLVLHAELNVMMKMMIGGKIQEALDKMAETVANSFNGTL